MLTLSEAAERLGVHYMTAYRYVRTGRLPAHKAGVEWRVEPADLAAFIADRSSVDPARAAGRRIDYRWRLVDRLVAGDERGAWSILQDALTAGLAGDRVYLDVIAPALTIIGDEWAAGRLSVAQEHQASGVVHRLIGRLGPLFVRRGRTRGTIVLGAPAGDNHGLPTALFADLARAEGFRAVDLGADTPPTSFVDAALRAERLVAVGITATTPADDEALAEAIRALHAAIDVPIVVGGASIRSAEHAGALGADGWAATTPEGLALFAELADDASQTRRRTRREAL